MRGGVAGAADQVARDIENLRGLIGELRPAALAQVLEGLRTDAQRALQFVRSTPGVGTALCGMRSLAHVEENARLVGTPPAPSEKLFARA